MKCLTVYYLDGKYYGSEIEWARSGSGFYRQTTPIVIPQTKAEIIAFAEENGYAIEWRGDVPDTPEPPQGQPQPAAPQPAAQPAGA